MADCWREHSESPLTFRDFYSTPAPAVQVSKLLLCCVLRLFFPWSFLLVMLLLWLRWISPLAGSESLSLFIQTKTVFVVHHALAGAALPFCTGLNVLIYILSPWYRSSGPSFAVFFPWLLAALMAPVLSAASIGKSENLDEARRCKCMRLLVLLARQFGGSADGMKVDDLMSSDLPSGKIFTVRSGYMQSIWRFLSLCTLLLYGQFGGSGNKSSRMLASCGTYAELYSCLLVLLDRPGLRIFGRRINECKIQIPSRHVDASPSVLPLSLHGLADSWPTSDRFLAQQQRVRHLRDVMLCVHSADCLSKAVRMGLLPSYVRSLAVHKLPDAEAQPSPCKRKLASRARKRTAGRQEEDACQPPKARIAPSAGLTRLGGESNVIAPEELCDLPESCRAGETSVSTEVDQGAFRWLTATDFADQMSIGFQNRPPLVSELCIWTARFLSVFLFFLHVLGDLVASRLESWLPYVCYLCNLWNVSSE